MNDQTSLDINKAIPSYHDVTNLEHVASTTFLQKCRCHGYKDMIVGLVL